MRLKKPRVASIDEVRITRQAESVLIEFADEAIGGMDLKIGADVHQMTDQEVLDRYNDVVRAMEATAASYEHVAVEIPVGKPQIRYEPRSDQWVPRGDVLRCVVEDEGGEAVIHIDDQELSRVEFGRMLTTYSGWGMRIVFVPNDELHDEPVIVVREPENER